eukprot:5545029-Amphidinium_carterae.1
MIIAGNHIDVEQYYLMGIRIGAFPAHLQPKTLLLCIFPKDIAISIFPVFLPPCPQAAAL